MHAIGDLLALLRHARSLALRLIGNSDDGRHLVDLAISNCTNDAKLPVKNYFVSLECRFCPTN
jgi:hypothetical protein